MDRAAPPSDLVLPPEVLGPLEALIVFKRTGQVIRAWSRQPIPMDVVVVMGATLLGSIDTLIEALGGPSPQAVTALVAGRRLLLAKAGYNAAILLVAPEDTSERDLRDRAFRIVGMLGPFLPSNGSRNGRGRRP